VARLARTPIHPATLVRVSTATAVAIPTALGALPAQLWLPPGGSGPGIVLFQEIFGISPYVERRAAALARAGYVVLAPEFYWRLGESGVANGPEMLTEGLALMERLDWDVAVRDALAAHAWLSEQPQVSGPVGYVGFCFGGGLAFATAAQGRPHVLVSYYGSALPNLLHLAPQVSMPSLHHFGNADAYLDRDTVERIRAAVAGPRTEFYTYPDADHAFDNADFVTYHPEASTIAWGLTLKFLAANLPT
jgi:carboxymethylenebutenolidase